MKKIQLITIAIFWGLITFSQQNPSSLKWFEINSEHTKVIFPKGMEKQAQKAANLIDYLYPLETKTLKGKPKKLPLLLYNQSVTSNAFVGMRPWRSAWFNTASQYAADLGTEDWFYLLGSHEFRHAVQYKTSNQHLTKAFSVLMGQTGTLFGQYSYPFWFFEGDAVCMETALSNSGRGRNPQFNMAIRTILLNDKKISYDKAKLRSYKTFYPDHYKLGWLMTSYARKEFGADIWDKTLKSSSKFSFWPFAFSMALKHHTGLNERKLYYKAMSYYDSVWTEKVKNIDITEVKIINTAPKKSWTKYTEANYFDNNHYIVKKGSMKSDLTSFYLIDNNGKEFKLKATDAGYISTAKGKVVFARSYPDLRWELKSYSDIIVYDIPSDTEIRLTNKQRFFAPAISNDGKKIAVIENNEKMESSLVIIDSKTGKELMRYSAKNNNFLRTPSWNIDNKQVTFTQSNENGSVISVFNIKNKQITDITKRTSENIGRPVFYKNYIIYNSAYSGIGNIYAIDINSKNRYQITSRKFGAYNPRIKNDKMVFSDYSVKGYDIAEIKLDESKWKKIEDVKNCNLDIPNILTKQEQNKDVLKPNLIPNKTFEVKKYNKLRNAVNIHSWGVYINSPTSIDENTINFEPEVGFDIYSANVMNTVFGSLGGSYNINENTMSSNISAIFKKYYPVFSISSAWAQRSMMYSVYDNISDTYKNENDKWEELKASFSTSIPFDFSSGIYYKGANLSTSYSYISRTNKDYRYLSESSNGDFSTLGYTGNIYAFRHQATQDINPKFGYFLYAKYQNTPFNTNVYGNQFTALSSFYLPGLLKHHSINIKLGYEKQRSDLAENYYLFQSSQFFPRGQNYFAFNQISTFSANYTFPIWYPDIHIGPIVYFKRLRANIFYDYASANELFSNENKTIESVGAELFLQMYFLRLGVPFEIGGRISRFEDGTIKPEFIMFSIPF